MLRETSFEVRIFSNLIIHWLSKAKIIDQCRSLNIEIMEVLMAIAIAIACIHCNYYCLYPLSSLLAIDIACIHCYCLYLLPLLLPLLISIAVALGHCHCFWQF